jgi:hypothetical protein
MLNEAHTAIEVAGLYKVIPLNVFRRTEGVSFDFVPLGAFPRPGEGYPRLNAVDRVVHVGAASSPGRVGDVERPWYMHPHQDDNLLILHGARHIELYTKKHGRVEVFVVTPGSIRRGGEAIYEGAALLCWPRTVFHRVKSEEEGSAALNFAVHHEGIDYKTNFNIYDLDTESGKFRLIREAWLDQPSGHF